MFSCNLPLALLAERWTCTFILWYISSTTILCIGGCVHLSCGILALPLYFAQVDVCFYLVVYWLYHCTLHGWMCTFILWYIGSTSIVYTGGCVLLSCAILALPLYFAYVDVCFYLVLYWDELNRDVANKGILSCRICSRISPKARS